jgi:hypothetical protein
MGSDCSAPGRAVNAEAFLGRRGPWEQGKAQVGYSEWLCGLVVPYVQTRDSMVSHCILESLHVLYKAVNVSQQLVVAEATNEDTLIGCAHTFKVE